MNRTVFVCESQTHAVPMIGSYLIDWCKSHQSGLGGSTGRSPQAVWKWIWNALRGSRRADYDAVTSQKIFFLDEYFGGLQYRNWCYRHLLLDRGGFSSERVFTPRSCFFENAQLVSSIRLEEILTDFPHDWEPRTEPGEDGEPPEIRICESAEHPVLREIRQSMADYDSLVQSHNHRLQLLGIGVGGAIAEDSEAGGHCGFVECGAAAERTTTMLCRLAKSTNRANRPDFELFNSDGDASTEPAQFAITQGISTILSAGELLMMAWGDSKRTAVERMFLAKPSPKNPAGWLQTHANANIYLDRAAWGSLDADQLRDDGWQVEFAAHDATSAL